MRGAASDQVAACTLRQDAPLRKQRPGPARPRGRRACRSTWLVPMQKQPMQSRRRALVSASAHTRVLLRMPSTCTSRRRAASSPADSAVATVSCQARTASVTALFPLGRTTLDLRSRA